MPPTGSFLLDTNIVIALFADEPTVRRGLEAAEAVYLPVIVMRALIVSAAAVP